MFTRRNWLLRVSIIINVAVILYLGTHVMIGGGSNFSTGSAYIIQDETPKAQHLDAGQAFKGEQANVREPLSQQDQSPQSTSEDKPQQLQQRQQQQQQQTLAQQQQPDEDEAPAAVGNDNPPPEHPIVLELKMIPDKKMSEAPTDSTLDAGGIPESSSYVNNSSPDGYMVTGDEKDFDERLRSLLKCHDHDYKPVTLQRGDFWVLQNYVRAEHGELKCHETITYTTHADYTFLDNLIPLLDRWNAPISIALHAPGTDFAPTVNSIKYLRDCLPDSNLVRQFVTFHIYFSTKHIPKAVPKSDQVLNSAYNCTIPPPFFNLSGGHLYKTQKKLLYPVNVGRNIARDAALTHFILASDIELYPNPGLVKKFLEMIARNEAYLHRKAPRVFPLSIFEVESSAAVPRDKTELQELLRLGKAIPFHKRVCSSCHGVPKSKEWMAANETEELGIFHIGKRVGYFVHWEPIYIGTNADPHYDERLSWEGKSDKMTQGYALCVLDYEFHILDNAFLVHKPGIKVLKKDPRRAMLAGKTNQLIKKIIYPELRIMYGQRKGCAV